MSYIVNKVQNDLKRIVDDAAKKAVENGGFAA